MKPVLKNSLIFSIFFIILSILVFIVKERKSFMDLASRRTDNVAVEGALSASNEQVSLHLPSPFEIEYSDDDFPAADESRARLSTVIEYRRADDRELVSVNNVPPKVLRTTEWLNASRVGLNGSYEMHQLLSFFLHAQYPPPEVDPRSYWLGDTTPEDPQVIEQDKQIETDLSGLGIDVATVRCDLMSVNLLELIARVSKDAQVDVGLLPDGSLVFGHAGKWASSNSPLYQLEFSDKQ